MKTILQLWCLVQVVLATLTSAAPQEANGIFNIRCEIEVPLGLVRPVYGNFCPFCRTAPNVAQVLPILRGAILANRNPGLPQDGSADLRRGPVINVIEVVLGSAREA